MRDTYSGWTCSAVYRLLKGTFGLALRRGLITRSPMDGLAPSERPKQKNAKKIAVLDGASMEKLVAAGSGALARSHRPRGFRGAAPR